MHSQNIRELQQRGRERQRERYKTMDLITEYNDFMWECNRLATFPSSSLQNRMWQNNQFWSFTENVSWKMQIFSIFVRFLVFHIRSPSWKEKKRNERVIQERIWQMGS